MIAGIERTFQRFGFLPLMTPALEYLDILTGKYGEEGEKLLYRFQDQGERDVALRYDLTVPLARVAAQYPEITLPFRRYQIAPVWRAEKPARGRFREFVQCDADIVGSRDMMADAELLQLACELLACLGVEAFSLRWNNRKVLSGLMAKIGVSPGPEDTAEAGVLRTVDKLPKIGVEETMRLLREENGLGASQVEQVSRFLNIRGSTAEILNQLRGIFDEGSLGRQGTKELAQVFAILEGSGAAQKAEIDLSIARGLNYYTGTIYEAFLGNLPGFGAVMGGGRYDSLIGIFKGEEIPGVGISLGIDRLLEGLLELGVLKKRETVARVLVTVFDPSRAAFSARVAGLLRASGISCELFPAAAKIKKQFQYAERSGKSWVVVAGPDEEAKSEVSIKDLQTGIQESVGLDGLAAYLSARVGAPGSQP